MFTRSVFTARLEFASDNEFVYIVSAKAINDKKFPENAQREIDVYKLTENGQEWARHLYHFYGWAGYQVEFPYVTYSPPYDKPYVAQEEDWGLCNSKVNLTVHHQKAFTIKHDAVDIINRRPELSYLIDKYRKHDPDIRDVLTFFNVVKAWNVNEKIESLVELGQMNLAISKKINHLKHKKIKEVIKFINENKNISNLRLNKILYCLSQQITYEMYDDVYPMGKKLYDYLKKQDRNYSYYKDYIGMAKEAGHNVNDDYWKYPKNLNEKHSLVMQQVTSLREVQNLLRLEKANAEEQERIRIKDEKLSRIPFVASTLIINNQKIGDYEIIIPNTLDLIVNQAKVLSQCLITSNYHIKMADQKLILVFIYKNGIPVATAEVKYDKKVGQFYGDEVSNDRLLSLPSEETKDVFYKWLEQAKFVKYNFEEKELNLVKGGSEVGLQNIHQ